MKQKSLYKHDRFAVWVIITALLTVEVLLAVRFILRLSGATNDHLFTAWLYDITATLVAPVISAFGSGGLSEPGAAQSVFDWPSVGAFVAYGIFGTIIAVLVGAASRKR